MGGWRDALLALAAAATIVAIVVGLLTQVWVAAAQLRRFSRIFAGRPEATQALNRVFEVYGWRARLAYRVFQIELPPGFQVPGRRPESNAGERTG